MNGRAGIDLMATAAVVLVALTGCATSASVSGISESAPPAALPHGLRDSVVGRAGCPSLTGPRGVAPDHEITVSPNAWVVSAGEKDRLLVFAEASRMEIGHDYLVPLVRDDAFDPAWQALSITSVLPFDGAVVGQGEVLLDEAGAKAPLEELSHATQSLWGTGREEVIRLLDSTPPDAIAEELSSLPPTARFREVQRATTDTE